MKRKHFLLLTASASAVLTHAARADFAPTVDNRTFPVSSKDLANFLNDSRNLRKFMKKRGGDVEMNKRIAREVEELALKSFDVLAGGGSRRSQFYLGRIYKELFWLTEDGAYDKKANKWLQAAEAQGHPGAVERQITRLPIYSDPAIRGQYLKAIRLGSVGALAACSGANSMKLQSKDWMKEGPVVHRPEEACVAYWSEVFSNWMRLYHYLIQWDVKNIYFRLNLPNSRLLEVVFGVSKPDDDYSEKLGPDVFRELVEKSATEASEMDKDFYPEEIYDLVWNKMFRLDK